MRRIRQHLSYANVMVTILAFVVLGGVSYAATGGKLILGQANTAGKQTSLTASPSFAGKALQLTNMNTGAGASALGLNVASGRPPFTVNSGTKVANLNADKLDGKDVTNWNVARVINEDGPIPTGGIYEGSGGGKLLIMASGSGYRSSSTANGPGLIGMRVSVDGVDRGVADVFANERNSHRAFVSTSAVVSGLSPVAHAIGLQPIKDAACGTGSESTSNYCTTTDGNDHFNVTAIEIP